MLNPFLSLLLSLLLFCSGIPLRTSCASSLCQPASLSCTAQTTPKAQPVFWGLIDPELSVWFTRLPDHTMPQDRNILWDWSWRGFLAALFGCPTETEAIADAHDA